MAATREILGGEVPYSTDGFWNSNRPVTHLKSRYGKWIVEAFWGDTYLRNLPLLKSIAVELDVMNFGISYDQAWKEVGHNMRGDGGGMLLVRAADNKRPPEQGVIRVFLSSGGFASPIAKMLNFEQVRSYASRQEDEQSDFPYRGYTTQVLWLLPTVRRGIRKKLKVEYVSTMALCPEVRRHGMGAYLWSLGNNHYQPDEIAFRSQTEVPYLSLLKTELISGDTYPLHRLYDTSVEKSTVLDALDENTQHPNLVDRKTGITKGVYPEGVNLAYENDPTHQEAVMVRNRMLALGLVPPDGDGMYFVSDVDGRAGGDIELPYAA